MKPDTQAGIDRYAVSHVPPGGFLAAVLANDLFQAVGRADEDNLATLGQIAAYVQMVCPPLSYGSPEAVCEWLKMRVVDITR